MRGSKLSLYEGGIREPFIIKWSGKVQPGTTDNETVMNSVDLLPTLTALAGIPMVPEAQGKFQGVDVSKAVLGAPMKREKPLMWEYGRTARVPRPKNRQVDYSPNLAIRQGDLKLLVNTDGSDKELYNVVADRNESKNLAADPQYKSVIDSMSKQVMDWQKTLPHRDQPYPAAPKQ
jgi:arylsulfatase A-like enzyme